MRHIYSLSGTAPGIPAGPVMGNAGRGEEEEVLVEQQGQGLYDSSDPGGTEQLQQELRSPKLINEPKSDAIENVDVATGGAPAVPPQPDRYPEHLDPATAADATGETYDEKHVQQQQVEEQPEPQVQRQLMNQEPQPQIVVVRGYFPASTPDLVASPDGSPSSSPLDSDHHVNNHNHHVSIQLPPDPQHQLQHHRPQNNRSTPPPPQPPHPPLWAASAKPTRPSPPSPLLMSGKVMQHSTAHGSGVNFSSSNSATTVTAASATQSSLPACIIKAGSLLQKRITGKTRRTVLLVRPVTTDDVVRIRDELAVMEKAKSIRGASEGDLWGGGSGSAGFSDDMGSRDKEVEIFGHLSFSAVTGIPLLILGTTKKIYIHMTNVSQILDEKDLASPCQFQISTMHPSRQDYRFTCDTSPDYQQWIVSLQDLFREVHGAQERRSIRGGPGGRVSGDRDRPSGGPRASSVGSGRPGSIRDGYGGPEDEDYEYRRPAGRPASVHSTRSNRSVRSNRSTRSTRSQSGPRAPGDRRKGGAGGGDARRREGGPPRRGGGPRAPGDRERERRRSVSAGSRTRQDSSRRRDDYDPNSYQHEEDPRYVSMEPSHAIPRNVTGPDGQPLRSSLSRRKSATEPALNASAAQGSSREMVSPNAAAAEEVFMLTKIAYERGLADDSASPSTPSAANSPFSSTPTSPTFSRASASMSSRPESSQSVSAPNTPGSSRRPMPRGVVDKVGLATRSGSLVRFSGQDESIVISPDSKPARTTTVSSSTSSARSGPATVTSNSSPRDIVRNVASARSTSPSPAPPSSPLSPSTSTAASVKRLSTVAASVADQQQSRRPPTPADQRRVVESLFEDDDTPTPATSSKAKKLLGITGSGVSSNANKPENVRVSSSLGDLRQQQQQARNGLAPPSSSSHRNSIATVPYGKHDDDKASIHDVARPVSDKALKRLGISESAPDIAAHAQGTAAGTHMTRAASEATVVLPRRPSNASTTGSNASTVKGRRDKASVAPAPPATTKEKTGFSFSSLFGGKKSRRASQIAGSSTDAPEKAETSSITDSFASSRSGRGFRIRRASSAASLDGASSGSSGVSGLLKASFSLVPSVRVPQTASLASMFKSSAKDMEAQQVATAQATATVEPVPQFSAHIEPPSPPPSSPAFVPPPPPSSAPPDRVVPSRPERFATPLLSERPASTSPPATEIAAPEQPQPCEAVPALMEPVVTSVDSAPLAPAPGPVPDLSSTTSSSSGVAPSSEPPVTPTFATSAEAMAALAAARQHAMALSSPMRRVSPTPPPRTRSQIPMPMPPQQWPPVAPVAALRADHESLDSDSEDLREPSNSIPAIIADTAGSRANQLPPLPPVPLPPVPLPPVFIVPTTQPPAAASVAAADANANQPPNSPSPPGGRKMFKFGAGAGGGGQQPNKMRAWFGGVKNAVMGPSSPLTPPQLARPISPSSTAVPTGPLPSSIPVTGGNEEPMKRIVNATLSTSTPTPLASVPSVPSAEVSRSDSSESEDETSDEETLAAILASRKDAKGKAKA